MRASRLLSLLILLQLRVRLTADALAREFGVSTRTIYRDIDELSAAGIPIYGDRGPGGGFQLLDGYRTRLTGLLPDEAQALALLSVPGAAAELGLGNAALRLRHKMLLALPGESATLAGRMQDRFHVDAFDWYRGPEPARHLPALMRAVLDQRCVDLDYESWTGRRDWQQAHPLGLVLKGGAWYAVAAVPALAAMAAEHPGRPRTLKVSSIQALSLRDETFQRPAGFDLPQFWAESLAQFEARLRPEQALLRATAEGRRRLAELGRHAAEALAAAGPPEADGLSTVAWPVESLDQAARLVLSLAPEVEALAPETLRSRVRQLAEGLRRQHRRGGAPSDLGSPGSS